MTISYKKRTIIVKIHKCAFIDRYGYYGKSIDPDGIDWYFSKRPSWNTGIAKKDCFSSKRELISGLNKKYNVYKKQKPTNYHEGVYKLKVKNEKQYNR